MFTNTGQLVLDWPVFKWLLYINNQISNNCTLLDSKGISIELEPYFLTECHYFRVNTLEPAKVINNSPTCFLSIYLINEKIVEKNGFCETDLTNLCQPFPN